MAERTPEDWDDRAATGRATIPLDLIAASVHPIVPHLGRSIKDSFGRKPATEHDCEPDDRLCKPEQHGRCANHQHRHQGWNHEPVKTPVLRWYVPKDPSHRGKLNA